MGLGSGLHGGYVGIVGLNREHSGYVEMREGLCRDCRGCAVNLWVFISIYLSIYLSSYLSIYLYGYWSKCPIIRGPVFGFL